MYIQSVSIMIHISKMENGSEVITEQLRLSKQQRQTFQKLPEPPEQAEWKTMFFSGAMRVLSGAPHCI
jgi:hypothetical protein